MFLANLSVMIHDSVTKTLPIQKQFEQIRGEDARDKGGVPVTRRVRKDPKSRAFVNLLFLIHYSVIGFFKPEIDAY